MDANLIYQIAIYTAIILVTILVIRIPFAIKKDLINARARKIYEKWIAEMSNLLDPEEIIRRWDILRSKDVIKNSVFRIQFNIDREKLQSKVDTILELRKSNIKKELKDEHLVYMDDMMYLPIQYHRSVQKQPVYKGKGNYSVNQLEEICEGYKEYAHQQAVIKQNVMKYLISEKFNVEFSDEIQ